MWCFVVCCRPPTRLTTAEEEASVGNLTVRERLLFTIDRFFFFLTKQTYALHLLICDMDRYVLVLSFCQTDDGLAEDYKCKF